MPIKNRTMSTEYYIINHTKKQYVSTKLLYAEFEDNKQIVAYLSCCVNDTLHTTRVEDNIPRNYRYINLRKFDISEDKYECNEVERLRVCIIANSNNCDDKKTN